MTTVSIRIADSGPVREIIRAATDLADTVDQVASSLEATDLESPRLAADELRDARKRFAVSVAALAR